MNAMSPSEWALYCADEALRRIDYFRTPNPKLSERKRATLGRAIRMNQDIVAELAGYTAPADPFANDYADLYRHHLDAATKRVHTDRMDPAELAQMGRDLAAAWAQMADNLRRDRAPLYRIIYFQNTAAAYQEVADTLLDPDYWIEH